jgi:hypothetical protein
MKFNQISAALAACTLLAACAPSEKQQAQQLLDEATAAYNDGLYNRAHLLLDSLRDTYPAQVEVRRQGLDLSYTIQYQEALRTRAYADSMLVVLDAAIDSAATAGFDYVKTEYDDRGRYLYHGTAAEKNLRSYLHAAVDDYGATQLIASYRGGKSLGFTTVRLAAPDETTCTTQPLAYDDANNYHYEIQGAHYETLTFSEALDGGVLGYIALHADDALTLSYLGGSAPLNVTLTPADRQALVETYRLADLLKNRVRLMQEQTVAVNTIFKLEDKGVSDNAE